MENAMWAIEAKTFSGYDALRQIELPKPRPPKDRVLVRVTAAGVTPLEYTILSGAYLRAKAPLVPGNEGAGVIEDAGDSALARGSRVMFTGPYGVAESGAWQEWVLVKPEHLALVPDAINDVVAASMPVADLIAQITLIDLTAEGVADGVHQITGGKGVDIVIDSIAGTVTSEALSSLSLGGVLITLGYSGARRTTIDVTDLIWKRARMMQPTKRTCPSSQEGYQ
jgi:NADPH:quinone reductase